MLDTLLSPFTRSHETDGRRSGWRRAAVITLAFMCGAIDFPLSAVAASTEVPFAGLCRPFGDNHWAFFSRADAFYPVTYELEGTSKIQFSFSPEDDLANLTKNANFSFEFGSIVPAPPCTTSNNGDLYSPSTFMCITDKSQDYELRSDDNAAISPRVPNIGVITISNSDDSADVYWLRDVKKAEVRFGAGGASGVITVGLLPSNLQTRFANPPATITQSEADELCRLSDDDSDGDGNNPRRPSVNLNPSHYLERSVLPDTL